MKATWNGEVIAESNDTVVVEGNHYFPADSINREYFYAIRDAHRLRMEGHGKLLRRRRKW